MKHPNAAIAKQVKELHEVLATEAARTMTHMDLIVLFAKRSNIGVVFTQSLFHSYVKYGMEREEALASAIEDAIIMVMQGRQLPYMIGKGGPIRGVRVLGRGVPQKKKGPSA